MRTIILWLSLVTYYLILSGQFSNPTLVYAGFIAATMSVLISAWMGIHDHESLPYKSWLRTFRYLPWLMWQIVLSNWEVLRLVLSPSLPISPRIISVPHRFADSPYALVTYANSITLTPGTVTIAVDDDEIIVHSLTQAAADGLMTNEMHDKVEAVIVGRTSQAGSARA